MATPETPGPGGRPKYVIEDLYKQFSPEALTELADYLSNVNPLSLPIQQIRGFGNFRARHATVFTQEATSSALPVDLATPGPELADLPPGQYVLIYGAAGTFNTSSEAGDVALYVNGSGTAVPSSSFQMMENISGGVLLASDQVTKALLVDLTAAINSVKMRYGAQNPSADGVAFSDRWLISLRVG